jgi:chromosome segregation protein
VFRSGVSEYSLNKTPCRLKDIRDLFFDTGMGSHAYSVIERSMVDNVLSDNSGHRRFLFEEAAGITKYKARKREALHKLDATEGDLVRLNDILFELERELRSLGRQVGKARRYQRWRDEIRELDLTLTAGQVEGLKRKEAEAKEQWEEEAVRREGITAALDKLEASLNDRKLALLELERELTTAQGGLRDREEARNRAEQQVVLLRERAAGLLRRADEAASEARGLQERLAEAAEREAEAASRRAALRTEREAAQSETDGLEQALGVVESELGQRREMVSERKQLSLDLFSTEADKRGAVENLRARRLSLDERREAAAARRDELEARVTDLARTVGEKGGARAGLEAARDAAQDALAAVDEEIGGAAAGLEETGTLLAGLQQQSAAGESRLETLLDLKRNFDGVSEGVKALLTGERRAPGTVGMISDVLEVPARYLDALEASLGEAAAFVLVEDRAALEAALAQLRGLESGRATLVDLGSLRAGTLAAVPSGEGVLGRASDLVRCEERYRTLVERLLGAVVVVEDRTTAARLALDSEGGLRFVSLDGEVWERGRVRAGSARNLSGLLHRENEIRVLTGELAERRLTIEALGRERQEQERQRQDALVRRGEAARRLEEARAALQALERELEASEQESRWAQGEVGERRREIAAYESELDALTRALAGAEADLADYERQIESARAQLADLDGALRGLEARRQTAATAARAAGERLLRLARDEGEWESQWARAEQTRREIEAGIGARERDERESRAKATEVEAEVTGLSSGLTGLLESEATQRERVVELQKRFRARKEEVQAGEEEARQLRFQQTELGELLHQIELGRVQTGAELDRTFERLRTEYELEVERWEPAPPPEGFDAQEARARLEEMRAKFRALGPVNLLAVDEYAKKKERWKFLTQQRTDLSDARTQLLEAIEKINVTASRMFVETFAQVQDHFRDVFRTLFDGGDAELRMQSEDPLEAEIEIVAKPRGKHLQSITLMSGGERALTAIALLFAIYLVKPSPFCLLDEVDAPLDDANVDRFIHMLRRFSERTQFVVITHNKRTMEAARCLYGVTMEELGVSKLVSVRLDGQPTSPERNGRELAGAAVGK